MTHLRLFKRVLERRRKSMLYELILIFVYFLLAMMMEDRYQDLLEIGVLRLILIVEGSMDNKKRL